MAKVKRKFGPVEPLDREKMKQWVAEVGVVEVAVSEEPNGDTYMQRVGLINIAMLGVKKRFQKVPKVKVRLTGEDYAKLIEKHLKK